MLDLILVVLVLSPIAKMFACLAICWLAGLAGLIMDSRAEQRVTISQADICRVLKLPAYTFTDC